MSRFLLVGLLFSAVCACLGRPQEPAAPAAATVAPPAAPIAATTAAAAGTWFYKVLCFGTLPFHIITLTC